MSAVRHILLALCMALGWAIGAYREHRWRIDSELWEAELTETAP